MKDCARCAYVGETVTEPEEDDEGLYFCNWKVPLPYSMRWCERERVCVKNSDAEQCPCYYEEKA